MIFGLLSSFYLFYKAYNMYKLFKWSKFPTSIDSYYGKSSIHIILNAPILACGTIWYLFIDQKGHLYNCYMKILSI